MKFLIIILLLCNYYSHKYQTVFPMYFLPTVSAKNNSWQLWLFCHRKSDTIRFFTNFVDAFLRCGTSFACFTRIYASGAGIHSLILCTGYTAARRLPLCGRKRKVKINDLFTLRALSLTLRIRQWMLYTWWHKSTQVCHSILIIL